MAVPRFTGQVSGYDPARGIRTVRHKDIYQVLIHRDSVKKGERELRENDNVEFTLDQSSPIGMCEARDVSIIHS